MCQWERWALQGTAKGGGVGAGIAAVAAVRAECDFNIDELWWFKYLEEIEGPRRLFHWKGNCGDRKRCLLDLDGQQQ